MLRHVLPVALLLFVGCKMSTPAASHTLDAAPGQASPCAGGFQCTTQLYQLGDDGSKTVVQAVIGCGASCEEAAAATNGQCQTMTRGLGGHGSCDDLACPTTACVAVAVAAPASPSGG